MTSPGVPLTAPEPCPACGWADDGRGTCREIFEELLALEYSVAVPFGRLHGLTVPAYYLQHPGETTPEAHAIYRRMLETYRDEGLPALEAAWRRTRAANSHRVGGHVTAPAGFDASAGERDETTPAPRAWTRTIASVTDAEGRLDAAGHGDRVDAWARAILDDLETPSA